MTASRSSILSSVIFYPFDLGMNLVPSSFYSSCFFFAPQIRLPKGLASRYWEEVVLALIGGQFPGIPDGEICGLVISIRYSEDILGVWNRSASDRDLVDRLRDAIKKVLQLPPSAYASMEYKPHQNAIADRSSFRNANSHWKNNRQTAEVGTTPNNTRHRSGSWAEREHASKANSRRDSDRAWR